MPARALALFALTALALPASVRGADFPAGVSDEDRALIEKGVADLSRTRAEIASDPAARPAAFADADLFLKGVQWALRYETKLTPADVALIKKAIDHGRSRFAALANAKPPWAARKGKVARGYVSAVDGSTQPFGLVIPAGYDPAKPTRLDVVLHGSSKPVGLSELRFISRFDEGDDPVSAKPAPAADFIELHPLGRVENCYRWAGEADVFEAIEAVCRSYNIDRRRIVLRGMSMGASGTWHLGLKHPDRFVALGPYCGYVDTHRFSETPVGGFVKVGELPEHQERMLHMLDSVDYAANAAFVPAIGAIGDKDVFFQAHVIMGEAMKREGLEMINLISPGTGHVIDPPVFKEQMRRIGEHAAKGTDPAVRKIRFVTWTLKYADCAWIRLLGLTAHYSRAEIRATADADGNVDVEEPAGITRFAVLPPMLQGAKPRLRVGGAEVALPAGPAPAGMQVARQNGKWVCVSEAPAGKRPGLQGPIDDAFTAPFLCVRGTGKPWNPKIGAWADANLARFAYEWHRYFRGELPVKDDTAVTKEDLQTKNLILFGDPGSNYLIARALPGLPIKWTREMLTMAGRTSVSANHAPALICPNPLPGAAGRYIVLNSGHTFHEAELAKLNYLLFPRLGDWAELRIGWAPADKPSDMPPEDVVRSGFFDEDWK